MISKPRYVLNGKDSIIFFSLLSLLVNFKLWVELNIVNFLGILLVTLLASMLSKSVRRQRIEGNKMRMRSFKSWESNN